MPITSRSEYGMRAMILLATLFGEERLSASELARRGHIPVKYLEQILAERAALYGQADLSLDTGALGVDGVVDAIANP